MTVQYNLVKVHEGRLLDDEENLTLVQLCRICRAEPAAVHEMVEEGILEPQGDRVHAWLFPFTAVEKVQVVLRFQRDLRVNTAGAALALHLLEKIAHLESLHGRGTA